MYVAFHAKNLECVKALVENKAYICEYNNITSKDIFNEFPNEFDEKVILYHTMYLVFRQFYTTICVYVTGNGKRTHAAFTLGNLKKCY